MGSRRHPASVVPDGECAKCTSHLMHFRCRSIGCAAACVHHARSLCARRTAARETPSPGPCRVARAVCPRASPPVLALRPLRGDHETQGAKTGGGQIRETNLPCPASLCVSMATPQGAAPPATATDVPHAAAGQGVRIARVPLCGGAPLRVRDCAPLHGHGHTHTLGQPRRDAASVHASRRV